jgi:hypothetical protein
MPYEDSLRVAGVGFAFSVPVPLPKLGHKISIKGRCGSVQMVTLVEQVSVNSPGIGPTTIMGGGVSYHERDRFGIFSRSAFQLRLVLPMEEFMRMGFVEPIHMTSEGGKQIALLQPAESGRAFCAAAVNSFVDLHTVVFGTVWLPRITKEDMFDLCVMNWEQPDLPRMITVSSGIGKNHSFVIRKTGYPCDDPSRVETLLGQLPLRLWEELLVTAQRDLVTGDLRSGMIHVCLGFETYIRHLLTLNSPEKDLGRNTLNDLCTRPEFLTSLVGHGLESVQCDPEVRASYRRIAALRNQLLHKGALEYEWISDGQRQVESIKNVEDGSGHLDRVVRLIDAVGALVAANGHESGLRDVHRCPWTPA